MILGFILGALLGQITYGCVVEPLVEAWGDRRAWSRQPHPAQIILYDDAGTAIDLSAHG